MSSHPIFVALGSTPAAAAAALYTNYLTTPSGVPVVVITADAGLEIRSTDLSGTPGAATINNPAGKVAIALGAASVVVTNSLVTANSCILATLNTTDATLLYIKSVVPGSGSFTITGNAVATADVKVSFLVFN